MIYNSIFWTISVIAIVTCVVLEYRERAKTKTPSKS